ncbi:MAG: ChrB protein [Chloroflexi bacterium]|jgi:deoxyribodipyrimidine photolyase|nr:ChrB protein [Chloroflexota bacterium]
MEKKPEHFQSPDHYNENLLNWDILIYRVPTEPARKRTYIWRQLKKLGVVYLQHGVCILPDSQEHMAALRNIVSKVVEFEGEATLLKTISESQEWQQDIIQRFHDAREQERVELRELAEQLHNDITLYNEHGPLKYSLLDRLEERLEQCKRDLAQIKEYDYFDKGANGDLEQYIAAIDLQYQDFCQKVWSHHDVKVSSGEAK